MDSIEILSDEKLLELKIKYDEKLVRYMLKVNEDTERTIILMVNIEKELIKRNIINYSKTL
jgi:hypothetical protein